MNDKPLIHVQVGDVVRAYFDHYTKEDERHCVARVVEISKRFGGSNPLLKVAPADGYELAERLSPYFDQGFVVEVVSRAKNQPVAQPNAFKGRWSLYYRKTVPARGVVAGSALELIADILATLDIRAETNLDFGKCEAALQHAEGLVRFGRHGVITVNIKRFKNWVRKNYTRLLMTAKDAHKEALRDEEDRYEDYCADLEADWERDYINQSDKTSESVAQQIECDWGWDGGDV